MELSNECEGRGENVLLEEIKRGGVVFKEIVCLYFYKDRILGIRYLFVLFVYGI